MAGEKDVGLVTSLNSSREVEAFDPGRDHSGADGGSSSNEGSLGEHGA